MKRLMTDEGLKVLEAFCLTHTLFAFDYDGTLAPICDHPDNAEMRESTRTLLKKLTQYVPVAVISGRKRSDVEQFLPAGIDFIIGNHGVEGLPSGTDTIDTAKNACLQWKSALKKDLINSDDVWLEDKTYSLSLHYRKATDKKKARTQLLEAVSSLTPPPRIVLGKFCINIMPAGAPHKGVALLELMLKSGTRCAVYLGDDDNDEDVFSLSEENLLTIRIENSINSGALYCLNTQLEIDDFLVKVLEFCESHGKPKRMT